MLHEIRHECRHVGGLVAQPERDDAEAMHEMPRLPIEEQPGAVEPRHENQRCPAPGDVQLHRIGRGRRIGRFTRRVE